MRPIVVLIFSALLLSACNSREEAKAPAAKVGQSTLPAAPAPPENPAPPPPQSASPPAKSVGNAKVPTLAAQAPPQAVRTSRFLKDPLTPELVEYPTAALPVWRQYREVRPTLVLLSNDPCLQPVPAALKGEVGRLIATGSTESLRSRTRPWAPDPLLMPSMAVDAALQGGFFGKVIWVLPTEAAREKLSTEAFKRQLLEFGAIDEKEAASLKLKDGIFSATIRGVPWAAVPISEFKGIKEPAVIHIDLSFLKPLYRNEIKTPLHPLVGNVFRTLQGAKLQTCAVTISLSQMSRQVPLDTRFLGPTMAALVSKPAILDGKLPLSWDRRGQIFYLQNFFEKERVSKLALAMEKDDPKDPSVHYTLYQSYREMKDGDKALAALDRAVALDKAYALEYVELTEVAKSKGRPDEALRMFALAEKALPDNPFITLEKARFLISVGKGKEALPLIARLKNVPWSPVYQPQMPQLLKEGEEKARLAHAVATPRPAAPHAMEKKN